MKTGNYIRVKSFCWIESHKIIKISLDGFSEAFSKYISLLKKNFNIPEG